MERMQVFDAAEVDATEIDELGHMTVSRYVDRALRANRAQMTALGIASTPGAGLVEIDIFTRFHREQFLGAWLTVDGGILEVGPREIRAYYEVRNPSRGEIAATFIIATARWSAGGQRLPLPLGLSERAQASLVDAPEFGRSRTLELSAPNPFLDMAAVVDRFVPDPMWTDFAWTVEPGMCAEHGFLTGITTGVWQPPGEPEGGEWTFECDGLRLGWASLETRNVRVSPVRPGDRLRSVGAEVALYRKARHTRRWLVDAFTGRLVTICDDISVALDLDARRTTEIPPSMRRRLEAHLSTELA